MIEEIQSIADIQQLALQPATNWSHYGNVRVDQDGELLIFNYTAKAQYEGRWNFFERVSRGLIINSSTGEVVARPFDKVFNWMENGIVADGHIVHVMEKMDGSLGIVYRVDNPSGRTYRVSTRGSFSGEQAVWATEFLNLHYTLTDLPDELTLLVEIIYPDNRIVVDYGDREDLVLLAARNRFSGDYLPFTEVTKLAEKYGFSLPALYAFDSIDELRDRQRTLDVSHEGWVVEFSDGSRFKFKGDEYLELHRLIYGLSFKGVLEAVAQGKIHLLFDAIPDEFLNEAKAWVAEIEQTVCETQAAVNAAFAAAPKETRKDFALWVQQYHKPLAPYLFAMLDGQEIEPMIYKTAFRNRSE